MRKRFGLIGISADQYGEHLRPMNYDVSFQDGGGTAVVDIDGYIGRDLLREFITGEKSKNTVENLKDELRSFAAEKIIVNIHSPGGDLSEGLIIKDMLQAKKAEVITNLQGLSASAATAIHQAGTTRRMAKNTSFMLIHRAMIGVMGFFNQNSFRAFFEDQQTIDNRLIQMYTDRAAVDNKAIAELMDAGEGYGKWIDAAQALDMGLIDEIYEPADAQDENIDRLENRKKAIRNNIKGKNFTSVAEMFQNATDDKELQDEDASAMEAKSRILTKNKNDNGIFETIE